MTQEDIETIKKICFKKGGGVNGRINEDIWWVKNNVVPLYNRIKDFTSFLSEDTPFNIRLYHILNNIQEVPTCHFEGCNNKVKWQIGPNTYSKYCSHRCNTMANRKFGSENTFSKQETKDKITSTMLSKYGVDNYSKTKYFNEFITKFHSEMDDETRNSIIDKRIKTNLEKYGCTTPLLNPDIIQKAKETMISNYGVASPLQSHDLLAKARQTTLERHGSYSYNQRHFEPVFVENLKNPEWIRKEMETKSLKEITEEYNISHSNLCAHIRKAGIDLTNYSYLEREIKSFIESLNPNLQIQTNNNSILGNRKQIDIFLPELNIGIECNGLYWHTESHGKDKHYHLSKTTVAEQKGIKLIHIFENEWNDKRKIVESRLRTLLSMNTVHYARKFAVKILTVAEERSFLLDNHLQGYAPSSICYGLVDQHGEIFSLMSFGKSRYNKKYDWELIRYAVKTGYAIVGGSDRLFKSFVKSHSPKSIVSYCDRRWFTGELYKKLGFVLSHSSSPNYFYLEKDGNTLSSRVKYQKHKLKKLLEIFDENLSEWDNMQNNGYTRVWDCGNTVWVWTR